MNLEVYFKAELTCDCGNTATDPQEQCNCEPYLDIHHFDIGGVSFLDVVNSMGKFHCPPELFEDELADIVEKIRDSILIGKECSETHQPIRYNGSECPLCEANGHISELMTENRELKEQVLTLTRSE